MDFIGKLLDHIREQLKDVKPFSWQVSLLLSLFSWFTYLLIREPAVKQFVSLFGWFFLIIGTDWALMKQDITIPGFQFKIKYGPWLTGAFLSCAFWSNGLIIYDAQGAFVSWPLFSVVFAGYSRFIQPGPTFKTPNADQRRDLVILGLVGMLFSCWFRFHFLLQDFSNIIPVLLPITWIAVPLSCGLILAPYQLLAGLPFSMQPSLLSVVNFPSVPGWMPSAGSIACLHRFLPSAVRR
ncbi:MAG: DUF5357 domain-containing protein [Leptolyngbyaceae cyanobacterium CRU_2_3]|nr:DUF5357 domain-containing protein [Leptolyngbyaceae cyanobacterium CRU_2_3]